MKSDDLLLRLSKNHYYVMSTEEKQRLEEIQSGQGITSSVDEDNKKKLSQTVKGTAAVKEIGKIEKHSTDPVSE